MAASTESTSLSLMKAQMMTAVLKSLPSHHGLINGGSAEKSAKLQNERKRLAGDPQRAAKRQKGDAGQDAQLRIGYYNASKSSTEKSAWTLTAIETWIQMITADVRSAVEDDALNVVCLTGLGPYGESSMAKQEGIFYYVQNNPGYILP